MLIILNVDDEFGPDGPRKGQLGEARGYQLDDAEDFFFFARFSGFDGYFIVYPHMLYFYEDGNEGTRQDKIPLSKM